MIVISKLQRFVIVGMIYQSSFAVRSFHRPFWRLSMIKRNKSEGHVKRTKNRIGFNAWFAQKPVGSLRLPHISNSQRNLALDDSMGRKKTGGRRREDNKNEHMMIH